MASIPSLSAEQQRSKPQFRKWVEEEYEHSRAHDKMDPS